MPQIAQQDYLRPSGKSINDCHLLAALAHNIQQGTIFDTLIEAINANAAREISRIVAYNPADEDCATVFYCDTVNTTIAALEICYNSIQYEGLAAIQDARETFDYIPAFRAEGGLLFETEDSEYVGVDGKKLAVTVKDGKIAALTISEENDTDVDISWEDAQKLIGLPIA